MLSEKETSRALRRFHRERALFSRRMDGLRREREQTLDEARTASEYALNIARMLALRTQPASVETSIKRRRGNSHPVYGIAMKAPFQRQLEDCRKTMI